MHSSSVRSSPEEAFARFVESASFPCVGAKSALNKSRMRFGAYGEMGDVLSAARLDADLRQFAADFPQPGTQPVSFVATFDPLESDDEMFFEKRMWAHLQLMHDADRDRFAWDGSVSADPAHHDFSFSIAGRAFFVVGLHPGASRLARRAPMPSLVFNFHNQFEAFKSAGKYASLQSAIRLRDTALQGFPNPVLARFGESSEARQYSGREVPESWRCPFSPRKKSLA